MLTARMLALGGAVAVAGLGVATADAALTGSAAVDFRGAIDHAYHARCELVTTAAHETEVELFFAFRTRSDGDNLAISQMRPDAAVGTVNLRSTHAYRVAFYDTDGRTWGAGWQPGRDLGSGTAEIGAGMETGHLTVTLAGVTDKPAPLHATVTWNCR